MSESKTPNDKEPLLAQTPTQQQQGEAKGTDRLTFYKYGSLAFLILQNSSQCASAPTLLAQPP